MSLQLYPCAKGKQSDVMITRSHTTLLPLVDMHAPSKLYSNTGDVNDGGTRTDDIIVVTQGVYREKDRLVESPKTVRGFVTRKKGSSCRIENRIKKQPNPARQYLSLRRSM